MSSRQAYSLRRRLLLWLLIPLFFIEILALFDAYQSARETANRVYDRVLTGSALAIAERVFVNRKGNLEVDIPYVALDMLTSAAQDRVFYRLDGAEGKFVTGYRQLLFPEPEKKGIRQFSYSNGTFQGTAIRVAVLNGAASTGGRSIGYRIAVAETMNARNLLTRDVLFQSAIRQTLIIVTAAIIVWFAVTRSLVPLGLLQEAIGRRSPDDLRPILHHVPNEVNGLVKTINSFIERLQNALEALRRFTANASHQIRTPLTIIKTQLSLAQRVENIDEMRAILKDCDQAVSEAESIMAQLLMLARIDEAASKSFNVDTVDLVGLAKEVTRSKVLEAAKYGFDLGFEGEGRVFCLAETVLLKELLSNLIENSIKHGIDGHVITVRVFSTEQMAVLQVEDDGPGIPEDQYSVVVQRFEKLSRRYSYGSGLGLAIVAEITNLFSGSLKLREAGKGKGLIVDACFPLKGIRGG